MISTNYHALIPNRIFMGGALDIPDIVEHERIDVIVDLREEATQSASNDPNVRWIKIPLDDHPTEPQNKLFHQAILEVVSAYRKGEKVAFHCGGGKGRTGTVATCILMELGLSTNLQEAEAQAKEIRPILSIKPIQMEALERIYVNHSV
ncbi:dual specificity protein phosphatase family protein [Paenibacillus sp. D2_2]|uniref:protein-tyrosine phosphatase family protein n=1 Tax=Paenibacillus sp. D2_2 TaxID=3073092 RepID=UPI002815D2E9|nr:dual specificity protein phosphatase family protein [Paenibacillus sp. D2_2]WMT43246.1 dual specificity protein phosphatase family protein [Paenibacillus sp. D2_2]